MEFQKIHCDLIDFGDQTFFLQNNRPRPKFLFCDLSLTEPIWLQKVEQKNYRIIDGFARINQIYQQNSDFEFYARLFSQNIDVKALWKKRVLKRLSESNFDVYSFLDSLIRLTKSTGEFDFYSDLQEIFSSFGISRIHCNLPVFSRIYSRCNEIGKFTELSSLNFQELHALSTIADNRFTEIVQILTGMKLKGNKLKTILMLLDEIEKGRDLRLRDIRTDKIIQEIRKKQLQPSILYKELRKRLETLRYPLINQWREKWHTNLKQLNLPSNIEIIVDPDFEQDFLSVKIDVSSMKEMKQIFQLLTERKHDEIETLFEFI